jgi:hypothetical protein
VNAVFEIGLYFQKKAKSGADVVGETESQKRTREADMCEVVEG